PPPSALFPYPTLFRSTAQLAVNGGSQHPDKRREGGHGPTLADEIEHLLPTPEAADGSGGRRSAELGGHRPSGAKRAITLATALEHVDFGDYAPAIARWEHALGRPAPAPTEEIGRASCRERAEAQAGGVTTH